MCKFGCFFKWFSGYQIMDSVMTTNSNPYMFDSYVGKVTTNIDTHKHGNLITKTKQNNRNLILEKSNWIPTK